MNKFYYLTGLLIGFVMLVVGQLPGEKTRMVVCDVGQGDAILIIKGRNQVLVDGGPSGEKVLACLGEHVPFWDRTIELIVLSNTDYDHLNGLSSVVERYEVIQFVTSDGVHSSDSLSKLIDRLDLARIKVVAVERGDVIKVGQGDTMSQLIFEVLWPPMTNQQNVAIFSGQMEESQREQILGASAKRGDLNERSVVLYLLEGGVKVLLNADSGDQTEKELIKLGNLPDIDILKVGHHGSKYASTTEYLDKIKPELAIISVGAKNSYGHPTNETLDRLQQIGAQIKRTDQEGTIVIPLAK